MILRFSHVLSQQFSANVRRSWQKIALAVCVTAYHWIFICCAPGKSQKAGKAGVFGGKIGSECG